MHQLTTAPTEPSNCTADNVYLHNLGRDHEQQRTALMKVDDCDIRFQLDTGADVNIINSNFVRKEQVIPTKITLMMWNGSKSQPLGEATLDVCSLKDYGAHRVKFIVVQCGFSCLLVWTSLIDMNLIHINGNRVIACVRDSSDLGDLGSGSLKIDPSITPRVLPCRILIALADRVKTELSALVDKGIVAPVDEPTDWVNQMAVVEKPNGKLRICIDPQPLNVALKREHYRLPVLDDILPELRKAQVFSKLDVKHAFRVKLS